MASGAVTAGMVALSVVALLLFLSAITKIVRRGEWSITATVAAVCVMFSISFVELVVTYLNMWQKTTDEFGDTYWVMPGQAHLVWRGCTLLLGVGALAVFIIGVKRRHAVLNVPAVLYLVLSLVSFGSSVLNGDNPFRPVSIVFVLTLLACTVAPRGVPIHVGIGTCCIVAAIAAGFTFLVNKDFSVFACTAEKCGPLGFNFQGILENENALALYLALAMPFVYVAFDSWEGPWLCGYMLVLIVLTGSRTGSAAGVITLFVLMLMRPTIRKPNPAPIRTRLLYLGLAAVAVTGIALPFTASDPTKFHSRAYAWLLVRDGLSDPTALIYGRGVLGWQHVADAGLLEFSATYSAHNQWMQVLYSTGLIGLLLLVALLVILLWRARGAYSLVAGCVLVPVFVSGLTEQPWPIDTTVWLTWVIPGAVLCYPEDFRRRKDAGEQQLPTPADHAELVQVTATASAYPR